LQEVSGTLLIIKDKINIIMEIKRKNKLSKYPFGRTEIAGTFEIDKADVPSMKTALKAFNARHGENMVIDYYESQPGRVLVTRIA
jgi:hypothetical protein